MFFLTQQISIRSNQISPKRTGHPQKFNWSVDPGDPWNGVSRAFIIRIFLLAY